MYGLAGYKSSDIIRYSFLTRVIPNIMNLNLPHRVSLSPALLDVSILKFWLCIFDQRL